MLRSMVSSPWSPAAPAGLDRQLSQQASGPHGWRLDMGGTMQARDTDLLDQFDPKDWKHLAGQAADRFERQATRITN